MPRFSLTCDRGGGSVFSSDQFPQIWLRNFNEFLNAVRKQNIEGPNFFDPSRLARRVILEVNSKTQFHLARGVNRAGDPTKLSAAGKAQAAGIGRLEMI